MKPARLAAILAVLAAGGAPARAEEMKIAFVYVSPVGTAGWTYQHELGRRYIEQNFAGKVKTTFVENVPEGADAERVIRQLAAAGNRIVFATSFGYMDPTVKVAAAYPNVIFEHATGYKRAKNVGTYIGRFEEGRFLAGLVAGRMSKTGVAGYVGAFPIPEVIRSINAFTIGMREVNPKATVRVVWVNSWYDPGKEREATEALIGLGADVIMQETDSTVPVQVAEAKGVYAIGYNSDLSKFGPKSHLVSTTHDWTAFYRSTVEKAMQNRWKSEAWIGGLKEGTVRLAGWGPMVPDAVRKFVTEKEAAIKAGKLHIFQGPLKTQDGALKVAAGKVLAEKEAAEMSYYVEGVIGQLPRK